MAVESRAADITFDLLKGRLHREATRKQAARSTNADQEGQPLSAFAAGFCFHPSGYRDRGYGQMGVRGSGRRMHGGFPAGGKVRGIPRQRTVTGHYHYCNKEDYWKNDCFKRKNDLEQGKGEGQLAFMGMANEVTGSTQWIIDSGA